MRGNLLLTGKNVDTRHQASDEAVRKNVAVGEGVEHPSGLVVSEHTVDKVQGKRHKLIDDTPDHRFQARSKTCDWGDRNDYGPNNRLKWMFVFLS